MCNCNKNVLVFNLRNGNYCGCCGEDQSKPGTGGSGIDLPSGGANGDVLAKQDDKLIWKNIITISEELVIPINTNNQILFVNAIPENKVLIALYINGSLQNKTIDYNIDSRNINWVSSDFNLSSSFILTITVL